MLAFLVGACEATPPFEPLSPDAESARPLTESQITALALPFALVRALHHGQDTPVFALFDTDGDTVGFQFELPVEQASLQARGLRRISQRLNADLPSAVWLTPASRPSLGRVAVMTSNPTAWGVKSVAEIPSNVDGELLDELWGDETTVLHAVGPDWLELEFAGPADELLDVVQSDEQPLKNQERVQNSLRRGWIRLPVN